MLVKGATGVIEVALKIKNKDVVLDSRNNAKPVHKFDM